jgi:Icc-related predicted phosphoesterase
MSLPTKKFKIWFISDTHGKHPWLQVPEVDMVIHCGDESESGNAWMNEPETREFFSWYCGLSIPLKVFVPGNHSTAIEQGLIANSDYPSIKFLIHNQVELQGIEIFGSPFTPKFFDWAYMKERSQLNALWQTIPANIDILITHGPPLGILDVTRDMDSREPIHVGSKSLAKQVDERILPRIHAFGHIHDEKGINNFGHFQRNGVTYLNCSCCDIAGRLKNNGMVVEYQKDPLTLRVC